MQVVYVLVGLAILVCSCSAGSLANRRIPTGLPAWNAYTDLSGADHRGWSSGSSPSVCEIDRDKQRVRLISSSLQETAFEWQVPENAYYNISGDVYLENPGSAGISISLRDINAPKIFDIKLNDIKPRKFSKKVLLNKGDKVCFGMSDAASSSWSIQIQRLAHVPSAWEPVKVNGKQLSCWSRTYDFTDSLMPRNIRSLKHNLFKSEMQLIADQPFRDVEFIIDQMNPEFVVFKTRGYSDDLKATCFWRLEYDGMLLCNLKLEPKNAAVDLKNLELIIPFETSVANLFHTFPYAAYNTTNLNSGAIAPIDFTTRKANADKSMTFADFLHAVWIGNEKVGLQWFAESDEPLRPASPFATITAQKTLKLSLLKEKRIDSNNPFEFTFGLQASPVKRVLAADKPRYGMWSELTNSWNHDVGGKPTNPENSWLHSLAAMGMECTHPWSSADGAKCYAGDPCNVSKNSTDYQMDKMVSFGRRFGIAVMANSGVYIEDIQPGTDWKNWGIMPYTNWGFDGLHYICQRSDWKMWYLNRARKALQESVADGFYCDGNGVPWKCTSQLHGCGYDTGNGRVGTVAILDTREAMKHLYLLSRDTGRRTCIIHHMSGTIMLPSLSFADGYVDGEHLQMSYPEDYPLLNTYEKTGDRNNLQYVLASYRAEMMGHQFGVPAFVLRGSVKGYEQESFKRTSAYAFVHGRLPLGGISTEHSTVADAWKYMDDFGVGKSRFIGYWENKRPVVSDREAAVESTRGIKIGSYVRKGKGALCVIANFRQPTTRDSANIPTSSIRTTIKIDRSALGIDSDIEVKSLKTRKTLPMASLNSFTTTITDGDYQWILITPFRK